MNAVESLILFTVALFVTSYAIFLLLPHAQHSANIGVGVSRQIASTSSFCIESVYSNGSEANIYIYGVSGTYRFVPRVYVDGMDVNILSYGILRDRDGDGYLDPRDLGYVEINTPLFDGNLHLISVWLGNDLSELTVLSSGDPGNCVR